MLDMEIAQLLRPSRPDRSYQDRLQSPPHRLAQAIITRALVRGADAICVGYRADIVPASTSEGDDTDVLPPMTSISPERELAAQRCTQLRGTEGEIGVPVSFRINGTLHHFNVLLFPVFEIFLEALQHGLVSIGASEANPQPVRYFEIGKILLGQKADQFATIGSTGNRRFAEIDLEYQRDNTIWIHLRGTREVDASVRVTQTIC
jgi:hypothetical protein